MHIYIITSKSNGDFFLYKTSCKHRAIIGNTIVSKFQFPAINKEAVQTLEIRQTLYLVSPRTIRSWDQVLL